MKKKILDEAQVQRKMISDLTKKQMSKQFNYSLDDFEIYDSQWRHKDWKTFCKGCGTYAKTKEVVERYIAECKKPYGNRDLSQFHLVSD